MKEKKQLKIVIKLGTSSIVDEVTHQPKQSVLSMIVETAIKLRKEGHHVIIVSSGAIGVGLQRMNIDRKPKHLPKIQALAAIGQCRLMSLWDFLFNNNSQPVAQILLTRNDIADRTQYVNAQNTLTELLSMGVIPIVNENDTLAVTEIKFGDNDTLSAFTAAMISADYLFLMTDVDCLYTANPRTDPNALPLPVIADISGLTADVSSSGSSLGTGGMSTKIVAAQLATSAGVTTIITRSSRPDNIPAIIAYTESLQNPPIAKYHHDTDSPIPADAKTPYPLHTRFVPSPDPIHSRSFWLLHTLNPLGTLYIDSGALSALANGAGLLPAGILGLEGTFYQQQPVRLCVVASSHRNSSAKALALDGEFTYHNLGMLAGSDTPSLSTSTHSLASTNGASSTTTGTAVSSTNQHQHQHSHPHPPTSPRSSAFISNHGGMGEEVGRALVTYSSSEIAQIRGVRSTQISRILGYADSEYVCLRENIALFKEAGRSRPQTPGPGTPGHGQGQGRRSGEKTPERDD